MRYECQAAALGEASKVAAESTLAELEAMRLEADRAAQTMDPKRASPKWARKSHLVHEGL